MPGPGGPKGDRPKGGKKGGKGRAIRRELGRGQQMTTGNSGASQSRICQ